MKRTTPLPVYKHPSTYTEIVEAANRDHAKRIGELRAAAKMILAIEQDLAALTAQGIYYSTGVHSMYLQDWYGAKGTVTKKALYLGCSMWGEYGDRLVSTLVARDWIAEDAKLEGRYTKILLRRPKTRIRLKLECSEELARQLLHEAAPEAA
ncbi:hypothetical protein [Paraburkholderia caribensis]|uniref:hypothetical protein n=1 Tax=Paraburkholderia caribensis TaxID=75105 RepID=UPI000722BE67|nr:hypothetical protein [Paraburkholderia caribensis]ALP62377.1 hypothetical protein AN416_07040 [Paraburkholderia caribensis]AUT52395.1 ACP synthase [Paraburkholderia caribensis]